MVSTSSITAISQRTALRRSQSTPVSRCSVETRLGYRRWEATLVGRLVIKAKGPGEERPLSRAYQIGDLPVTLTIRFPADVFSIFLVIYIVARDYLTTSGGRLPTCR